MFQQSYRVTIVQFAWQEDTNLLLFAFLSYDWTMDPETSKTITVAAIGRPFSPGMLYDCRHDSLIPGKEWHVKTYDGLWNFEYLLH